MVIKSLHIDDKVYAFSIRSMEDYRLIKEIEKYMERPLTLQEKEFTLAAFTAMGGKNND